MNKDEFQELFRVVQPQLMRFAQARLDLAAAEDAVSATLMTMWIKSAELRTVGDGVEREVRALAFKVLSGEIRNEYRARKRRAALGWRIGIMDPRPESEPDVDQDTIERQTIAYWLSHLSEADRTLVLLINADFTIDEIAGILDCSVAAVAKRRTRVRRRLNELLQTVRAAT